MDECAEDNGGCEHLCVNHAGGFSCDCPVGYELEVNGTCSGRPRFTRTKQQIYLAISLYWCIQRWMNVQQPTVVAGCCVASTNPEASLVAVTPVMISTLTERTAPVGLSSLNGVSGLAVPTYRFVTVPTTRAPYYQTYFAAPSWLCYLV